MVTRTLSAEGSQNGVNVSVELLLEVILGAGACNDLLTERFRRSPEVLALAESMVGIPEGAFKVLHSKQECYCFDTGKKDEEGRTDSRC